MEDRWRTVYEIARESSPYYTELYRSTLEPKSLQNLPVVDHTEYWQQGCADRRNVMTGPQIDGVILKTGGTTSRPKVSSYSQIELQRVASHLAEGMIAAGVQAGERVGNLFYAGDLYGSFLLHVLSIMALPMPVVHVPIGGLTAVDNTVELIEQCELTALLSTATSMVKISTYIIAQQRTMPRVRCIMFGGEPLFKEQQNVILGAFPNATIKGCIYGSIDSGTVAVAASDDDTNVYQGLRHSSIIEIIRSDGSNEPVTEEGETGVLVVTNLTRQLCPVIRYPTGDKAAWVDKKSQTFRLLGRLSQAVRLGPISIDMSDIRSVVANALPTTTVINGVQSVISRHNGKDQMECLVAASPDDESTAATAVIAEMYRQRPMFDQHVQLDLVAPLAVRFVNVEDFQLAPGSHKLVEIVEKRF